MSKSNSISTPKVVADPIHGVIDIRAVLPMVETPEFQALGDKRQLGMAYLTFPSATHSRKAHSLGSYHATQELAASWLKRGFVNDAEARAIAGYALYHDIGHPAFSHVTESLCELPPGTPPGVSPNAAVSAAIIERRRREIEACGIDFRIMRDIAAHKNPLWQAVSDKNLGMEKLDYLERDSVNTILSRPVGVEYLRNHIYYIDGAIAIDEKAIDNAIDLQNFYLKIYKNVYLRKTSSIAQRAMQKMVHHMIIAREITRADLVDFTDSELIGAMRLSKNDFVQHAYSLFRTRDLFREALVIRPEQFATADMRTGKAVTILGATDREMDTLMKNPNFDFRNQVGLEELENEIADIAGLPWGSVLVTPIVSTERFKAQDIMIYQGPGRKLASLKARFPAHFKNFEEVAQSYVSFRVCTTEKYRKTLSAPKIAKKTFELLTAWKDDERS